MTLPWKRFVAIGDSLTEGVGDPVRGGGLRGWADRLAHALRRADPQLTYLNLARRGLRTDQVRRTQLQAALAAEPDLVSALMGTNDLLDPGFEPARFEEELAAVVEPLTDAGALVMTATFVDLTAFSPLPARLKSRVRERSEEASEVVRKVSKRYDTMCVDTEAFPDKLEREIISVDRLHPSPHGHILLAQVFAKLLEVRSGVPIPMPDPPEMAGRLLQWRWLIRQLDPIEVARHIWRFSLAPRKRTGS
jgi:lysophospholipase L1-like esterase